MTERIEPTLEYDTVGNIMAYEQGDLGYDASVALFQHLYDSGLINGLQGSYGRTMQRLINDGIVTVSPRKAGKAYQGA